VEFYNVWLIVMSGTPILFISALESFYFDYLWGYKNTLGISQTQQRVFKGQIPKAICF